MGAERISIGDTLGINLLGVASIPMLAFIGPRVLQNDGEGCRVRIPLGYRTGNHLGSMYFGVLCAGADVVSGLPCLRLVRERQAHVVPSFKDLHAEFLKRADGDVEFVNEDLEAIELAFNRALRSGERVNVPVRSVARLVGSGEAVARFTTTLSMRHKPDDQVPRVQRWLSRL